VITLEDLQQLQSQRLQSAWFVYDDQGLMCWLIAAMPPSSDLEDALKSQLIERSLAATVLALARHARQHSLKFQQLEVRNQELVRTNRLKANFG